VNYTTILSDSQSQFEDDSAEFLAAIPRLVTAAENRIFKDVPNLPPFRTTDTGSMVTGTSTLTKPTGCRMVRQVSYTNGSSAEVFLERRIDSFIKDYWPTAATTSAPLFFAENDDDLILVGPTPDSAYAYTVYYLRVPTGLSSSNETTELGDKYENVLVYGTYWECAKFLVDTEAAAVWEKDYKEETAKLQQEVGRIYRNEYGSGV